MNTHVDDYSLGGDLTLDLSLTTGWTYGGGYPGAPITGGVWNLPRTKAKNGSQQLGFIMRELTDRVNAALYRYCPRRVLFESPISKSQTFDRLGKYLCGSVELACFDAGIACYEVAAPTARSAVLGRGAFPKPVLGRGVYKIRKIGRGKTASMQRVLVGDAKEEINLWLQAHGFDPVDDNHGDSIVLYLYAQVIDQKKAA